MLQEIFALTVAELHVGLALTTSKQLMSCYDDPVTERAVLDHLSRDTRHGGIAQTPRAMRSGREGNFVILANINGPLAYYRVCRHQTGLEYVCLLM